MRKNPSAIKKTITSISLLLFSSLLLQAQNVGIGNTNPTAKLHVTGMVKIDGLNLLEFGADIPGKELNAGKIGYNGFGTSALAIVGAGTNTTNRAVYFFAEGGTTFSGPVNVLGNIQVQGSPGTAGQVLTSNGVSEPEWANAAYSNNTRFKFRFLTTTSGLAFMDAIDTEYNLNTADITIGANSVTINKTGLYRIHGVIAGNVIYPAAGIPAWEPELSIDFVITGSMVDRVPISFLEPYRRSNAAPTNYILLKNFSLDMHIPAGTVIRLEKHLIWTGSPAAATGHVHLYGNLISE